MTELDKQAGGAEDLIQAERVLALAKQDLALVGSASMLKDAPGGKSKDLQGAVDRALAAVDRIKERDAEYNRRQAYARAGLAARSFLPPDAGFEDEPLAENGQRYQRPADVPLSSDAMTVADARTAPHRPVGVDAANKSK